MRKFIQVSTSLNDVGDVSMVAVCNDGTLWTSYNMNSFQYFGIAPQDEEAPARPPRPAPPQKLRKASKFYWWKKNLNPPTREPEGKVL